MLGSEGGSQRKRQAPVGPCWVLNSSHWRLVAACGPSEAEAGIICVLPLLPRAYLSSGAFGTVPGL